MDEIKKHLPQLSRSIQEREWVSSEGEVITLTEKEEYECLKLAAQKKYFETGESKLTEEEVSDAMEKALDAKLGIKNSDIYWKNVYSPKPVIPPTAENLYFSSLRAARSMIQDFSIDDKDKKIYGLLALYFAQDKRFEKNEGYSLKKGICLYGNVGCGKTTMMNIFRMIGTMPFPVLSCEDIVREYKDKESGGSKTVDKYINYHSICLDDIGTEPSAKHMGNESNVIREIINGRYNKEKYSTFKTHLTTNLSVQQFREFYGERFVDRCREMFNQIEFSQESTSKRK